MSKSTSVKLKKIYRALSKGGEIATSYRRFKKNYTLSSWQEKTRILNYS
jgi:hypothetical protein